MRSMPAKRRGQKAETCSLKCRRIVWALRVLEEALEAGRADGLRARIRELRS
jgi:hypothetical protein